MFLVRPLGNGYRLISFPFPVLCLTFGAGSSAGRARIWIAVICLFKAACDSLSNSNRVVVGSNPTRPPLSQKVQ